MNDSAQLDIDERLALRKNFAYCVRWRGPPPLGVSNPESPPRPVQQGNVLPKGSDYWSDRIVMFSQVLLAQSRDGS